MFNKDLFCGKIRSLGLTMESVAKILGINSATLSRKVNGNNDFTRNELEILRIKLSLHDNEFLDIFFA